MLRHTSKYLFRKQQHNVSQPRTLLFQNCTSILPAPESIKSMTPLFETTIAKIQLSSDRTVNWLYKVLLLVTIARQRRTAVAHLLCFELFQEQSIQI
jgi:hypothetical protein